MHPRNFLFNEKFPCEGTIMLYDVPYCNTIKAGAGLFKKKTEHLLWWVFCFLNTLRFFKCPANS
jgi:hypothetical protein